MRSRYADLLDKPQSSGDAEIDSWRKLPRIWKQVEALLHPRGLMWKEAQPQLSVENFVHARERVRRERIRFTYTSYTGQTRRKGMS